LPIVTKSIGIKNPLLSFSIGMKLRSIKMCLLLFLKPIDELNQLLKKLIGMDRLCSQNNIFEITTLNVCTILTF